MAIQVGTPKDRGYEIRDICTEDVANRGGTEWCTGKSDDDDDGDDMVTASAADNDDSVVVLFLSLLLLADETGVCRRDTVESGWLVVGVVVDVDAEEDPFLMADMKLEKTPASAAGVDRCDSSGCEKVACGCDCKD